MKDEIINFIRRNWLSSADVADALGRSGHVPDLLPVNDGQHVVGEVEYLYAWAGSNRILHRDLAQATAGRILFIDGLYCGDKAILGHLMAGYAMGQRKALALVVNGLIRDTGRMKAEQMPVWCKGRSPIICRKDAQETLVREVEFRRQKFQGGIMVCDTDGCVCIPPHLISADLLVVLEGIRNRESLWYQCIDQGKSTFEVICQDTE